MITSRSALYATMAAPFSTQSLVPLSDYDSESDTSGSRGEVVIIGDRSNGYSSEQRPLIGRPTTSTSETANERTELNEFDDASYSRIIREAERAIDSGILPHLIYQGSSGSYFVKNTKRVN